MADDSSDPRDPTENPEENTEENTTPDPAAFEEMLRSMGVDPTAASKSAEAAAAGAGSTPDFSGLGPLGPLMGMLGGQMGGAGGFAWDAARQSALWTAAGGGVEATVDPVDRIRIEEFCQQAANAVEEVTGLPVFDRSGKAAKLDVQVTTRAGWAAFALEDHRALLERVSTALASAPTDTSPSTDPLAGIFAMVGPLLLSSQAGSIIGQLATATLATHDWPIARSSDRLAIVSSSIDAFAAEWSIPIATARLHVCIADVALQSVLRIPHVRLRLISLMERHADAARFDAEAMSEELGRRMSEGSESDDLDSSSGDNPLAALGSLGGLGGLGALASFDASEFLGGSREQLAIQAEIEALMRPIVGYVDYVVAIVGARLLGDNRQVMEAWKRRRTSDAASRSAGRLLGPVITTSTYERGATFVGGVIQRAGTDGLNALWSQAPNLPTPAELDAPGLWLARIGLDS
jgi:putative hydrolase